MHTQTINHMHFHECKTKLRAFFVEKGFVEYPSQSMPSILAACEDPSTIGSFKSGGSLWALPQTGQMWLEYALLTNPGIPGFFCETTSYRDEPNPTPGRHMRIFPMFEFETHGNMNVLRKLESELLEYLGFGDRSTYSYRAYADVAEDYGVEEITGETEKIIGEKENNVFFLEHFPIATSPFWNMKMNDETANKIDVLLHGMETIGSAERATDPVVMHEMFYTISDGAYVKRLFAEFGQERVERELDDFLKLSFFPRVGGGIGVTRLMRALELSGLY